MAAAIGKLPTRHQRQKVDDESNGGCQNMVIGQEESSLLLKHNPGFSLYWTANEQSILETGIANIPRYTPETNVMRYAKIAMQLPDKTVRDVALRCKWTAAKERCKRRKEENKAKTLQEKKPASYASSVNDNSYEEFDSSSRQLLEQNDQALHQISSNMVSHQIQENISLFCECRANIITILKSFDATEMKQMPSIQAAMDEELLGVLLHSTRFLSKHL